MNKTNLELVQEFFNYIYTTMKSSDILELVTTNNLSLNRAVKVNELINEKLNSYGFEYNHNYLKNGNLLIYKDVARKYVQNNLN